MTTDINPAAPHHLPAFITAPGETDVLFNAMAIFLLVMVLMVGVLYFKLHALPERIAHKGQKIQFELVAVLALISLFTHNHIYWIAGLLLAFIPIPDFSTPLNGMADSLARMAGRRRPAAMVPEPTEESVSEPVPSPMPAHEASPPAAAMVTPREAAGRDLKLHPAPTEVFTTRTPGADPHAAQSKERA